MERFVLDVARVLDPPLGIKTEETEKTEFRERQKTSFPKEQVENTDLPKSALNKMVTTQEQWIRYNFVAPFIFKIHNFLSEYFLQNKLNFQFNYDTFF